MSSQLQVKILKGFYRGKVITGTFPLLKPFTNGAKGSYLTIRAEITQQLFQTISPRITVMTENDFVLIDSAGNEMTQNDVATVTSIGEVVTTTNYEHAFTRDETDQEAKERIRSAFQMLEDITDSVAKGTIRGLIVTGPPGIGKSCGVEKKLQEANLFRILKGQDPNYEIISGVASPVGLYQKLFWNKNKGQVLVFDDSDSICFDEECLSFLKRCLDSGSKRTISYNKESKVLLNADIPQRFDFEGSVIFLTNIDFENVKQGRIAEHLKAIVSRCHYLDMEIVSLKDKLLRIEQVIEDGMLEDYEFEPSTIEMIFNWIKDNSPFLREVSLRMTKKVADLVKTEPARWQAYAEATCLTRESKFRRLFQEKQQRLENASEQDGVMVVISNEP